MKTSAWHPGNYPINPASVKIARGSKRARHMKATRWRGGSGEKGRMSGQDGNRAEDSPELSLLLEARNPDGQCELFACGVLQKVNHSPDILVLRTKDIHGCLFHGARNRVFLPVLPDPGSHCASRRWSAEHVVQTGRPGKCAHMSSRTRKWPLNCTKRG